MNLWILTEEKPKTETLAIILHRFATDHQFAIFVSPLKIIPVLVQEKFTFTYEVVGFLCKKINNIYLKTVAWSASFVDFIVYYQEKEPTLDDEPIYVIEATKTDDSESRNTGVYQRASKFVFIDYYYPNAKKIMLYNLQIKQKTFHTATYSFGTRLLSTINVEILGKKLDDGVTVPFNTIDEIIKVKNEMRRAPKNNTPITIKQFDNHIEISARLIKSDRLSHDPNIGAISLICAAIRKLNWTKDIIITQHGLSQKHLSHTNKFILIANMLGLKLKDLEMPKEEASAVYWKYERHGEKLATIFIHLIVEEFTSGQSIFDNHAGCERGYFITRDGSVISIQKYTDRKLYKAGDKSKIYNLPDLILIDCERLEVINIEGKTYNNRKIGIIELENYEPIENDYIKIYYPDFVIKRTIVLYGGSETKLIEIEIGFLLNSDGCMILGIKAPAIFNDAVNNLIDFWKI